MCIRDRWYQRRVHGESFKAKKLAAHQASKQKRRSSRMGISRDSRHKRRLTGGRMPIHKKKRQFESGRPNANTKIGEKRIHRVRVRGGNYKFRALRLDAGNFTWGSQAVTKKTRVIDVVYNATNNELVRTKTLVKNAIIQIDATPFKQWYLRRYNVDIAKAKRAESTKKGAETQKDQPATTGKKSKHLLARIAARTKSNFVDPNVEEQFTAGRLLACISSRPGQSGRCDGYILEGKELEFYLKKIIKKQT
eukprot:TRINITY_DN1377_c0_g1_i3.p1 TRINITY_DN1377_c0_g1~~TRINITY_DN1377_c0_g1_i3.p1  ORF type:complete len:250 (-),score=98.38 TRINITY_DN1377_c0_g1_i3:261-1010(-)